MSVTSSPEPAAPVSLVLLHGHGGSPVAYEDLATDLAAALGCVVVVPAGPVELADDGRAWWEQPDEGPGPQAHSVVAEAIGGAGGQVVVVGFSQGAAMAVSVADLASVSAVVMVAGFLPEPRPTTPVTAPVLCLFGEADDVIDPFLSQMAARALERRGAKVDEMSHPGGHRWTDEVTGVVAAWVARTVGAPSS